MPQFKGGKPNPHGNNHAPQTQGGAANVPPEAPPPVETFANLSGDIFRYLPEHLRAVTDLMPQPHERDLFVTGALPVLAGLMPNVIFKYGGVWQSLNMYTCVVAPAAHGKGKLRVAQRIGEVLNQQLYAESLRSRREWAREHRGEEDGDGEPVDGEPPFLRLFIAGDTSASRIKESLTDTPHAVIFETEAKSLAGALQAEWGNFRDVLLKCFHNEPISVDRRYQMPRLINRPSLSMCLSGTPGSFEGIISDSEDGLFSRFMFYYFETSLDWQAQFEDSREEHLDTLVSEIANRVPALYNILSERGEPLYVKMPEYGRDWINYAGSAATEVIKAGNDLNLLANVKRAAINAFRIAGLFTVFDLYMHGANLMETQSVECEPDFVKAGVGLAFSYLEHALRMSEAMRDGVSEIAAQKYKFLKNLPEGVFSTEDAYRAAKAAGVAQRSAHNYLHYFESKGMIEKEGHGTWRRVSTDLNYGSLRDIIADL